MARKNEPGMGSVPNPTRAGSKRLAAIKASSKLNLQVPDDDDASSSLSDISSSLSEISSSASNASSNLNSAHYVSSRTQLLSDIANDDMDLDLQDESDNQPTKRRKINPPNKKRLTTAQKNTAARELSERLFSGEADGHDVDALCSSIPAHARSSQHSLVYHRPLLLHGLTSFSARGALLAWFDGVSTARAMPWRKAWIDPTQYDGEKELRQALERRAYEVWISEIMLQQTRVAVVKEYWTRWMVKWPTIQDLAAATHDELLAAWRGLGYYSRAERIHAAAKLVVADCNMKGLLPADVAELEAKIPGVGRYTAGAISAIVFGRAAPMVDGNVLRVLSRQLGILGDVKTNKKVVDVLWQAADVLVKQVVEDGNDTEDTLVKNESDRPGRWGQALMELGSTVCTPKPSCSQCPITSTCRAYGEGYALTTVATNGSTTSAVGDIEDLCTLCEPIEKVVQQEEDRKLPPLQAIVTGVHAIVENMADLIATVTTNGEPSPATRDLTKRELEVIANHAKRFPLRHPKKKTREEECLVCAVRRSSDGRYLLHRRPAKGLLANMWEFPSYTLPSVSDASASAPQERNKAAAAKFTSELLGVDADAVFGPDKPLRKERQKKKRGGKKAAATIAAEKGAEAEVTAVAEAEAAITPRLKTVGALGTVPWVFSHLKLTMHVHRFDLIIDADDDDMIDSSDATGKPQQKWATSDEVDTASMGTGMRLCWSLVQGKRLEQ